MVYCVTVSRNPDGGGFAFWLGVTKSGGPGLLSQDNARYGTRPFRFWDPGTAGQGFIGRPEFQRLFANLSGTGVSVVVEFEFRSSDLRHRTSSSASTRGNPSGTTGA